MGWKENIKKLNELNRYVYKLDNTGENDNQRSKSIVQKLNSSSKYTPIFKLHEVFHDKGDPRKLSIMHININSMKGNFGTLVRHLHEFERLPDIICITETHFQDKQNLRNFELCNYSLYVKSRSTQGGGGVAMYVNNNFLVLARNDLNHFKEKVFESLFLEIRTRSANFRLLCGVVYRHPKASRKEFYKILTSTVKEINRDSNLTVCLCGDFNFNLSKGDSYKKYTQIMHEHKFLCCINRPTRFYSTWISQGCTLIDHIWFNKGELFSNSAILVDEFSDHLAICCSLQTEQPHFPDLCGLSEIESHLQTFSKEIKTSHFGEKVKENFLVNQAQEIVVEGISKLDIQKNLDEILSKEKSVKSFEIANLEAISNNVNTAIDKLKNDVCDKLKKLLEDKEIIARELFREILKEAVDKVQLQLHPLQSSSREIWQSQLLVGLDKFTGKLVERSEAKSAQNFRICEQNLHRDEARETENAPLIEKDFIAIPENFEIPLNPFDLTRSQGFFLNKTKYSDYLSLLERFQKCSLNALRLHPQNPIQIVDKLTDIEARKKLFSLFCGWMLAMDGCLQII